MPLPSFTHAGDLPAAIYAASLPEIIARFGSSSSRRKLLALRLRRVYELACQTGHLARFVIFGSFVTAKRQPNDVDVFMIMDDNFNVGSLAGESRLLFNHGSAQDQFGCSVFWVRSMGAIGGAEASIEDWQIKRDGTRRGIVEVARET